VVWFGQCLLQNAPDSVKTAACTCDLMLVVGTSGAAYSAAGLALTPHQCVARVFIGNPASTDLDLVAKACLREPAAQCLPFLLDPP
jgi:NAD-dependent deacetylase